MSKQIEELKIEKTHSSNAIKERINAGTMTKPLSNDDNNVLSIDVNRLKADREFYQREYLKLKSRQFAEHERQKVSSCRCSATAYNRICCMEKPLSTRQHYQCCECLSDARNASKDTIRCDHMQQQIEQLKHKISELESENKSLHATHSPNKAMVNLLKEQLDQLRGQIDELNAENNRLQTSYNQLK